MTGCQSPQNDQTCPCSFLIDIKKTFWEKFALLTIIVVGRDGEFYNWNICAMPQNAGEGYAKSEINKAQETALLLDEAQA